MKIVPVNTHVSGELGRESVFSLLCEAESEFDAGSESVPSGCIMVGRGFDAV